MLSPRSMRSTIAEGSESSGRVARAAAASRLGGASMRDAGADITVLIVRLRSAGRRDASFPAVVAESVVDNSIMRLPVICDSMTVLTDRGIETDGVTPELFRAVVAHTVTCTRSAQSCAVGLRTAQAGCPDAP